MNVIIHALAHVTLLRNFFLTADFIGKSELGRMFSFFLLIVKSSAFWIVIAENVEFASFQGSRQSA